MRVKKHITWCVYLLSPAFLYSTSAAVYGDVGELPTTAFDFIVIGGGTAGAVVANRLTERSDFEVLVLEGGPTNDGVLDSMVPAFPVKLFNTAYDWNYTAIFPGTRAADTRSSIYPRGHILGGCSSHNAMYYTRGSSDDYNRFAAVTGDPGWSWDQMLPYMLKNEKWSPPADMHNTSNEFDPSVHGFSGMVFTSLPGFPQPSDDMVLAASKQLPKDFPFLLDMNSGRPLGLGWYQGTIGNGTRSSSATAYLSEKFTTRKNLHVVLNTKVIRIHPTSEADIPIFNTVEISGSSTRLIATKELILSAGAIGTPQILMNSGVGDHRELQPLGIPTVVNLPSVGKNFTDQPYVIISFSVSSNNTLDNLANNATLQAEALAQWELTRTGPYVNGGPNQISWSRLPLDSSILKDFGDPSAGPNTPHIELTPQTGRILLPSLPNSHFISTGIQIVTPASRGSVSLNTTDPLGDPVINLGFFTAGFDLPAMREGIRLAQKLFSAPVWKGYIIERFSPPENTTTDEGLDAYIRSTTFSSLHASGTAAMSSEDASYGVVNPDLLVKNVVGLRIVDASVLPFITCGHTQAPVYAIAERASDLIKEAWK